MTIKKILLFFFLGFTISTIQAQVNQYKVKPVAEFSNEKIPGKLFYTNDIGPDGSSGNGIVFHENGKAYIFQNDQRLLYSYDLISKEVRNKFPLNIAAYEAIDRAQNDFLLFSGGFGAVDAYTYSGEKVFSIRISSFIKNIRTESFLYYADTLFFIDDRFQLHSILDPSMDQEKNKLNYRTPEQTKKMFEPSSGVDLKGLTIDEKGLMYLNGIFIGPKFMPVVGKWRYSLNEGSIIIGNGSARLASIPMPQLEPSEILECTAIHPSGDIYFLRYNKNRDKHILYKIENTWDSESKFAWEKQYGMPN